MMVMVMVMVMMMMMMITISISISIITIIIIIIIIIIIMIIIVNHYYLINRYLVFVPSLILGFLGFSLSILATGNWWTSQTIASTTGCSLVLVKLTPLPYQLYVCQLSKHVDLENEMVCSFVHTVHTYLMFPYLYSLDSRNSIFAQEVQTSGYDLHGSLATEDFLRL